MSDLIEARTLGELSLKLADLLAKRPDLSSLEIHYPVDPYPNPVAVYFRWMGADEDNDTFDMPGETPDDDAHLTHYIELEIEAIGP